MSGTEYFGDIMVPNGKYIKDGEEKTSWFKCGAVFRNSRGQLRLKLDAVPTNMHETGGWFSVFERAQDAKPSQAPQRSQGFRQPAPADDDQDDIPF